jgi:avermectin B 5-O-methyltransferase
MTNAPHQGSPTPADVGDYYDRMTSLLNRALGGNTHLGYWPSPDDGSTLGEASDRLTEYMIGKLRGRAGRPLTRVLDVGCGSGRPAVRLARHEPVDVVGITISPRQVELATALAERSGLADRVRFECADAMDLPFPDASFDAVWALECLLHMPDPPRVFREMARVLRPGGRLAATDVTLRTTQPTGLEWSSSELAVPSLIPITEYAGMITDAGLKLTELTDIGEYVLTPSYSAMGDHVRAHAPAYADAMGMTADELETFVDKCSQWHTDDVGYVVLTADRPGA